MKKFFTLQEANNLIPIVKPILRKLRMVQQEIALIETVDISSNNQQKVYAINLKINKEYHKLLYLFYKYSLKLEDLGCLVKDPSFEIIDFYSTSQGKEIFLCFSIREENIKFWHEVGEGFDKRKSINILEEGSKQNESKR